MKKSSFLLGAAALVLATSCSNDEVVKVAENSAAIGFNSFVNNSTRTDYGTNDEALDALKVYGVSTGNASGTFILFAGQEVNNNEGTWEYSPLKYWISGNDYTFAAVAPSTAIADEVAAGKVKVNQGQGMENGGVTSLDYINSGNVDLLWAAPDKITNVATSRGAVELNLGHLLTRIRFQFVNATKANENLDIKVSDVKITNAANAATWTPTAAWSVTDANDATLNPYTFAMEDVYTKANNNATSKTQNLIPEGATKEYAANFTITLREMIGEKEVTHEYNHSITLSGTDFKAGNSYTLTANVDMSNVNPEEQIKPILFDVKVTDWADQSDTTVTLPSKPVTPTEGE